MKQKDPNGYGWESPDDQTKEEGIMVRHFDNPEKDYFLPTESNEKREWEEEFEIISGDGNIRAFIRRLLAQQKQEFEEEKMIEHLAWKKTLEEMIEGERILAKKYPMNDANGFIIDFNHGCDSALDTIKKRIEEI